MEIQETHFYEIQKYCLKIREIQKSNIWKSMRIKIYCYLSQVYCWQLEIRGTRSLRNTEILFEKREIQKYLEINENLNILLSLLRFTVGSGKYEEHALYETQ